MTRKLRPLMLLLAALAIAGLARAQEQTLELGVSRYPTHAASNGVTGPGLPARADASVGSATTALFSYEYRFMPSAGVELVLGVAALKVKSELVAISSTVLLTTIDFRPIIYSLGQSFSF